MSSVIAPQRISHFNQIKRKPGFDSPVPVGNRAGLLASTAQVTVFEDATGENRFVLSSDQATAADNVLRIERNNGTIVDRVWDGNNFWVDWVPMNTQIGSLGSTSESYTADKIRWAALLTHDTCRLHLLPDTTYTCNYKIGTVSHHLLGSNSKIQRSAQISATTTAQSEIGEYTLTVDDTSGFTIGSTVYAIITAGQINGHAMAAEWGAGFLLVSKTSTTLTFAQPLVKTVPIGKKVVILDHLLEQSSLTTPALIEGVEFDGNSSEHSDVLDFVAGWNLLAHNCEIKRCLFRNAPNENIAISAGSISHCEAYDLWGSFMHGSAATPDLSYGLEVHNNYGENIATKFNYHNEGVVTFSVNCQRYRIFNNTFDNRPGGVRGTGCFGNLGAISASDDDQAFYAANNKFYLFDQVISISNNAAERDFDSGVLEMNEFYDCRLLNIGSGSGALGKPPVISRAVIRNNLFVNCWATVSCVRHLTWMDNVMKWHISDGVYAGSTWDTFASLPTTRIGGAALEVGDWAYIGTGANTGIYEWDGSDWVKNDDLSEKVPPVGTYGNLVIRDCGEVDYGGGSNTGPGPAFNNNFYIGAWLYPTIPLKTEDGTTTTALMANVRVHDTVISNFRYGLVTTPDAQWANSPTLDVSGWSFDNVIVNAWRERAANGAGNVTGIEVLAGCTANNCTVNLNETNNDSATNAIILKGPVDATKNAGGIAKGCTVPYAAGSAQALRLGHTSDSARNKNCVAIGNVLAKAVIQEGTHDKIESGNVVLSSMTGLSAPVAPLNRPVGANPGLY